MTFFTASKIGEVSNLSCRAMKVAFRSIRSSGLRLGCFFRHSCSASISLTPSYRPSSSAAASTRRPTRQGHPFHLAVVGSGPAGFYTAHRVMANIRGAKVDMYEELPVPFGLVRFGVTPDYYPEAKVSAVLFCAPGGPLFAAAFPAVRPLD